MERIISLLLVASTTTARKVVILDNSEWDSIVVTSPPVKITNSRFNPKNTTRPNARMLNECEEGDLKCLYDNQLHENGTRNPTDTIEKFIEKYSGVTNVKINQDLRNSSSKAYWNQIDSEKHNHPFDDNRGWITLDPVPWSTSKVSKWKPNHAGDRPWMYGPPQQATSSPLWVTNGGNKRPSTQYGLATNDIITDNKPSGFPLDSGFSNSYTQVPALPNNYRPPQGPQYHPQQSFHSQFPSMGNYNFEQSTKQPPYQWPNSNHFPSSSPPFSGNFPNNYPSQGNNVNNYPTPGNYPINHPMQGNHVSSYPVPGNTPNNHPKPSNYPESGNGEWVLLSTTKGYSVPQRYYDRKFEVKQTLESLPAVPDIVSRSFKSKYLENSIDEKGLDVTPGNRKSDYVGGETVWNVDGINIIRTGRAYSQPEAKENHIEGVEEKQPSEMTYKRTVRLTVLPALNNTSIISHDGMLEVDANPQSVEEAQQEHERMKKLEKVAIVTNARRPYQIFKSRGITSNPSQKKAAVIAAVGAGMIPATMAVLLPAALGRRRRRDVGHTPLPTLIR